MQSKIWEYKSRNFNKDAITAFAGKHGLPPVVACLLMNRGITGDDEVSAYFKKSLADVKSPFDFEDMETATARIIKALENKEKIIAYGDYDVDGITSTAVLFKFLKSQGAEVEFYIPDRHKEGYGLNIPAINRLVKKGAKLIISVDCGITSVGEVEFAKTMGVDFIITDHHTCKEDIPRAVAVINPKKPDTTYGYEYLAGVGVAFKLILGLSIRMGLDTRNIFAEYADLVAIGTIADVVPLLGENRVIVEKGIEKLSNTRNCGIRALMSISGLEGKTLDAQNVAFAVSPRLNAAGRMESAETAVRLLIEENYERALEIAKYLDSLNKKRQEIEQEIYKEALAQIESLGSEQSAYVLWSENWHSGVIGIVASKLCEQFYRPCMLISCQDGKGKASGRSIEEMNLFNALSECDDILTEFGGHAQAAGFGINQNNIDQFRTRINQYAKKCFEGKTLIPKIHIDCQLDTSDITMNAAKVLSKLEPFGMSNEMPVFSSMGMRLITVRTIGADNKHLRLYMTDGKSNFNAIGFNMGYMVGELKCGELVSVAYNINVNEYNGAENLQLILKDVKM